MTRLVQVRLVGPEAAPGRIAAADVARLLIGLERALAQAAYVVLHRSRRGTTGRHAKVVEAASRLRFVDTEAGSFVQTLALPDVVSTGEDELELDAQDLSTASFDRLIAAIRSRDDDLDRELAGAIASIANDLDVGGRTQTVTLARIEDRRENLAVIDDQVRRHMQALSRRPFERRDRFVVGALFEADFERQTARLRTGEGSVVVVSFPEHMADDVQRALRGMAQLEGRVTYHRRTGMAASIEVRSVVPGEQLLLLPDVDDFEENLSVAQLQERQEASGLIDPDDLRADDWTLAERDAFFAALAQ